MKLKAAEIKNFRSIKDETISFDPTCRILVGMAEAGKSNILKALALLSNEHQPKKTDMREIAQDESPVEKSYVRFHLLPTDEDLENLANEISAKFLFKDSTALILKDEKKAYSIDEFLSACGAFYEADILGVKKTARYWGLGDHWKLLPNWKKPSGTCPADYVVKKSDGEQKLKPFSFVNANDFPDIPEEYLVPASCEEVNSALGTMLVALIPKSLPEAIYWTYNEANLLPDKIPLAGFTANPDTCKPLKYMFELTEIENIQAEFEKVRTASPAQGIRNLLNRVATRTTDHIHSVWKEHIGIKIQLHQNGEHIEASVLDKYNNFAFANRSDGFKRFITFLLMISCRVKTKDLAGSLIIIDEPDNGLHPSGARYLRDELIKISQSNFVIYSTHSIFMIDRKKIDRHLIDKKTNEITAALIVDESNVKDEEVIYNALGFSIFEALAEKNIIFEGWRDKELFNVALSHLPAESKELKKSFEKIGLCHVRGVKDVSHIVPLLQLANRACWILTDADDVAKQYQRDHEKAKNHGTWLMYSDLLPNAGIFTSEDFLKPEAILAAVKDTQKAHSLAELTEDQLKAKTGKLHVLKQWLSPVGDTKEALDAIKEKLYTKLKPNHIELEYYELLKKLAKAIETN